MDRRELNLHKAVTEIVIENQIMLSKFTTLCEIQKYTVAANDANEDVPTWYADREAWFSIDPLSAMERVVAANPDALLTVKIRGWWDSALKARDRIRDCTTLQVYEIVGPPLDIGGQHKYIEMIAKAVID